MRAAILSLAALLATRATATTTTTCNPSTLNTTTYFYPITQENTTLFDVAAATNRGICDIGRNNLMADVTIVPNVGQQILIPGETCNPDNTSCLLPNTTRTRTCINGGPRLYYTVNGDTYDRIAQRLNITTAALMSNVLADEMAGEDEVLEAGNFVKVPLCEGSFCMIQPWNFTWGVYKDLADEFGTTVGQMMMLSPTYNYSSQAFENGKYPPINVLVTCTGSENATALN